MFCTYFSVLLILVLSSDAMPSKRNFDPDSLMQNMMFVKQETANTNAEQRPSVFGAQWGFLIHNPSVHFNQYAVQSSASNFNSFDPLSVQHGTAGTDINDSHKDHEETSSAQQLNSHKGTFTMNTKSYEFNPNSLNHEMMSGGNKYDMLKSYVQTNGFQGTNKGTETNKKQDYNTENVKGLGTSAEQNEGQNAENQYKQVSEQLTENASGGSSNTLKGEFGNNADQLNKHMFSGMFSINNIFGNSKLSDNSKQTQSSNEHQSFIFDATDLNSKMFNSVGYNPVYVAQRSSKTKRNDDFNPNIMMSKYMEMPGEIKTQTSSEFDPNSQSMFPSTQHTDWGFSVYNPLHALEQYSGSNTGSGSMGLSTDLSGFNPNKLNDHLMSILNQKMEELSTPKGQDIGFNPNSLNNNLFEGLGFNPAVVNTNTVLPMFHENIPMPVLANQENGKNNNGLPGIGNQHGNDGTQSSGESESGYVKNTHSNSNNNGGLSTSSGIVQQSNLNQNGYVANTNGHTAGAQQNTNGSVLTNSNFNLGTNILNYGNENNVMFHGNYISQTGATNSANVQATGLGSLGGSVQTNGNGYHQSMYQQGPTEGMTNNASGTVTQTQAGGLGSTTVQQTGLATGGSTGSGGQLSNNLSQNSAGGLGSTTVQQTGTSNLGTQGPAQIEAGQLGSNTATQTSTGSLGSNVLTQTAAGSLGSTGVAQTGTGSLGSNTITQTGTGSLGSTTVSQTNAGGLGPTIVGQTGSGSLGSNTVSQTGTGTLGSNTVSQTAAGSLGSTSVGQTGAGALGSNVVTQTNSGGLGSNTVSQTNAGGLGSTNIGQTGAGALGSNVVMQTNSGGLGSNTVSQTNAGGVGSTSVGQTGAGALGSNVVTQTNSGGLGSNTVAQTNAGSLGSTNIGQTGTGALGSNIVTQTDAGGLGSNTVSQTAAGGVGSLSVGQIGSGTLGSNTLTQTSSGSIGSNSVTQNGAGSLGSNSVQQTNNGSLGSTSVSQNNAGSLGSNAVMQTGAGTLGSNGSGINSGYVAQTAAGGLGSNAVQQTGAGSLGVN